MEANNSVTDQSATYRVKVRRGNSENAWYQEYIVLALAGQSVLGALQYIYDNLDPTLAFAGSCRIGLCASCLVRVNGKVVRSCTTLLEGDIVIEPSKPSWVAKDLIVSAPTVAAE